MLLQEFEELTGIYLTDEHYKRVEQAYIASGQSKQAFCQAYRENRDGIAEKIAIDLTMDAIRTRDADKKAVNDLQNQVDRLRREIDALNRWKPYEMPENYSQKRYNALAISSSTETMTDDQAAERISQEFGFDRQRVHIIHSVPVLQINRDGAIRKVGSVPREPLWNAHDWNYIRFDVAGWMYEMADGNLHLFMD